MNICFFGIYNPEYSRNRILISGLTENGHRIIQCNSAKTGPAAYLELISKHRKIKNKYDFILVPFPSYKSVFLAKIIGTKPIIYDAYTSLYDTAVNDRKTVSKYSFKALYYYLLDKISCLLAEVILLDTNEHIKYFQKLFGIKKQKFIRVLVGADDKVFQPAASKLSNNKFVVHFHGNYIPLQGVQYIIKAAKYLENEDVTFNIIGGGQDYPEVRNTALQLQLKNVTFIGKVKYTELPGYINQADICLGIFGATEKAQRVIPNKLYEGLASAKPVITAATPAIEELLSDKVNIFTCSSADPRDLAEKILKLKNDPELAKNIAENGYALFKDKLKPEIITRQLIADLKLKKIIS